jgi:hypothetical protein
MGFLPSKFQQMRCFSNRLILRLLYLPMASAKYQPITKQLRYNCKLCNVTLHNVVGVQLASRFKNLRLAVKLRHPHVAGVTTGHSD